MSARAVFDEIVASTWDEVLAWKGVKEESLHLDFKRRTPSAPADKLEPADRSCIAKAFSGFANVEGGTLVLGVDARASQKDEPDKVVAIQPIPKVKTLASIIDRQLKTFTDPPIAGLRVETLTQTGGEDGIVVIYVPPSDGGPHRAVGATSETNDRYFMRTGTSTVVMPHSMLDAMFGRRPQPLLRLVAGLEIGSPNQLYLRLLNRGRGHARQPAVQLEIEKGSIVEWNQVRAAGNLTADVADDAAGRIMLRFYARDSGLVVYPNSELLVGIVQVKPIAHNAGWDLRLAGRILALDTQPLEFDVTTPVELKNCTIVLPEDAETKAWVEGQRAAEKAKQKAAEGR